MFQSQEDSLLEPGGGDDIAQAVVSVQESLSLAESKPHDEPTLLAVPFITLTDHVQEGLLSLSQEYGVSPLADVMTQRALRDLSG